MILTINNSWLHKGNLILVNKDHSVKDNYELLDRDLDKITAGEENIKVKKQVAKILNKALYELDYEGLLIPVSGYRTFEDQCRIYSQIKKEKGSSYARRFVAKPNESEHQTGLAFDIGEKLELIQKKYPNFIYRDLTQKFKRYAVDYGFIERYPKGKEKITGIGHEPWHFRYVGYPHSKIMEQNQFVLEEYVDYLSNYTSEEHHLEFEDGISHYSIYKIKANGDRVFITVNDNQEIDLSGDNVDGFIVTLKTNIVMGDQKDATKKDLIPSG